MEIRQLRYFVRLAEERHFGHVAEREHIAQSAVSEQIRRLEHELGVRLFDRTSRHVELTDAGRAMLPEVVDLLSRWHTLVAFGQRWGRGELGELTVIFAGHVATTFIPRAVAEFEARYVDVAVSLREQTVLDLWAGLADRTVDVVLSWSAVPSDLDVISEVLLSEPTVVAVATDHHLARHTVLLGEQVQREARVRWPGDPQIVPIEGEHASAVATADGGAVRSVAEMFTAVALGRGLALIPRSMSASYYWPGVEFRSVLGVAPYELVIARVKNSSSPAASNFVEVARTVAASIASSPETGTHAN